MTVTTPPAILFDLDGTLVETAPDLAAAMNHVLAQEGLPQLGVDAVRPIIGHGAKALITRGFSAAGRSLDDDRAHDLTLIFLDHYRANIAVHSHAFPGVVEALSRLHEEGFRLAVCTNKPQGLSEQLLDALDLTKFFHAIVGADAVTAKKPDPEHVFETLRQCQGNQARALFVGDSETDERAARAAGLPFILFPLGYRTLSVEDLAADAILTDYHHLPDLVMSRLMPRWNDR